MTDSSADSVSRPSVCTEIAARYDGLHAVLVRAVHPLCFASVALTLSAIAAGAIWIAIQFADLGGDALEVLFGIVGVCGVLIWAAFMFVLTPARAAASLVALGGWVIALRLVDEIHIGVYWTLWVVAALSVLLQIVLLVRVLPARFRNRLVHLVFPAAIGTAIGAVPVVFALQALIRGDRALVEQFTLIALIAGLVVALVMLALFLIGRFRERKIISAFIVQAAEAGTVSPKTRKPIRKKNRKTTDLTSTIVSTWASVTGPRTFRFHDYPMAVATGYTEVPVPDVPSVHMTVLAIGTASGVGPQEFWVRRRSWTHDNVLTSLGHAEVVEFESIRLSDEFHIRFPGGTNQVAIRRMFGPEVVDLLGSRLGGAQVCRIDGVLVLFRVGGMRSSDELVALAEVGAELAHHIEAYQESEERDASAPYLVDQSSSPSSSSD